jgi:hypothetical protein
VLWRQLGELRLWAVAGISERGRGMPLGMVLVLLDAFVDDDNDDVGVGDFEMRRGWTGSVDAITGSSGLASRAGLSTGSSRLLLVSRR